MMNEREKARQTRISKDLRSIITVDLIVFPRTNVHNTIGKFLERTAERFESPASTRQVLQNGRIARSHSSPRSPTHSPFSPSFPSLFTPHFCFPSTYFSKLFISLFLHPSFPSAPFSYTHARNAFLVHMYA